MNPNTVIKPGCKPYLSTMHVWSSRRKFPGQALCLMNQSFSWAASGDTRGDVSFLPCEVECLSVLPGLIIKLAKRHTVLCKEHQERAPSLADARNSPCAHLGKRPMAEMTSGFADPDPYPQELRRLLILGKVWLLNVSGEQNSHIPIKRHALVLMRPWQL